MRGALLLGQRRAVLWDTLIVPHDLAVLRPLIGELPLSVVYSHADWDHVWGTSGVRAQEIIAHRECLRRFQSGEVEATWQEMHGQKATDQDSGLFAPTRFFDETLTLDLGGLTLKLHWLPGHTRDCVVGHVPELGVLLGGDAVEDPLPEVTSPELLPNWILRLEAWARRPGLTVIPAHGAVAGTELIESNIAYLRALQRGETYPTADLSALYRQMHSDNLWRVHRRPS